MGVEAVHGLAVRWTARMRAVCSPTREMDLESLTLSSMAATQTRTVTELLLAWSGGDTSVDDELMSQVYEELRRVARQALRRERSDHTLQATALVHETYLRLIDQRTVTWQSRHHFLALAAQMMRRILVDHARKRRFAKRGGGVATLSLDTVLELPLAEQGPDLLALDDALNDLGKNEPEQARLVELRFFAGLSIQETADALSLSPATVDRRWRLAKAWLYRALQSLR